MTGNDRNATETLLRDALSAHTSDVAPAGDFVSATVDHSVASLRRTRMRRTALVIGAVAAVVALAGWQLPSIVSDRSSEPITHPDQSQVGGAYAWAQSLPRGADADVAYVDGDTLVIGSRRVSLDQADGEFQVLGALADGWVAQLTLRHSSGPPVYGSLRDDGMFIPYDLQRRAVATNGIAVSPDGTNIAYGDVVIRLKSSNGGIGISTIGTTLVEALPAAAREMVDWTDAGILYRDVLGRYWRWSPGADPIRLPYDELVPGGYGVARAADCVDVTRVTAPDEQSRTFELCDLGTPLTVSTNRRTLMSSGEFVNLEGGVDFRTIPLDVLEAQSQLLWETDDNMIIVVQDTASRSPQSVLVRCLITAGLCERASDALQGVPTLAPLPQSAD